MKKMCVQYILAFVYATRIRFIRHDANPNLDPAK